MDVRKDGKQTARSAQGHPHGPDPQTKTAGQRLRVKYTRTLSTSEAS